MFNPVVGQGDFPMVEVCQFGWTPVEPCSEVTAGHKCSEYGVDSLFRPPVGPSSKGGVDGAAFLPRGDEAEQLRADWMLIGISIVAYG